MVVTGLDLLVGVTVAAGIIGLAIAVDKVPPACRKVRDRMKPRGATYVKRKRETSDERMIRIVEEALRRAREKTNDAE